MSTPASCLVHVQPGGAEFEVLANESIMDAARRQNFTWPTVCQGMGACTACYVKVLEGRSHVSEMAEGERTSLDPIYYRNPQAMAGEFRLACQMTTKGPVTLFKRGIRRRST